MSSLSNEDYEKLLAEVHDRVISRPQGSYAVSSHLLMTCLQSQTLIICCHMGVYKPIIIIIIIIIIGAPDEGLSRCAHSERKQRTWSWSWLILKFALSLTMWTRSPERSRGLFNSNAVPCSLKNHELLFFSHRSGNMIIKRKLSIVINNY